LSVEKKRARAFQGSNEFVRVLVFEEVRLLANDPSMEKEPMTKLTILGAATVLSMMAATPVFAQAAIQEPGAFSFAHPSVDVLNPGVRAPRPGMGALAFLPPGKSHVYRQHHKRHVVRAGY
jgi:hypothetical protein